MQTLAHDTIVMVPTHGAIFDALMNANLLVQRATALDGKTWPVYGIYDDSGDWLEVWIKSEAQWESERYQ